MSGKSRGAAPLRWIKGLVAGCVLVLVIYQLWLLGWVLWWKWVNPETTRFQEIRLAELRLKDPRAQMQKQWTPYAKISVHLKRALIVSEDDLFVHHEGFDWDGIQKAMEKNQRRGKIVAGGSTISQQLAKNLFLSPDKTPWRKAEEAVATVMIEALWSKERIFEVYLNEIEWGNGVFGAEAAARHYYGIGAGALSPDQAAQLAAMVPSPRFYDRHRGAPGLAAKAAVIRERMPAAQLP